MIKVRFLDRCEFCDGEAYIFISENIDSRGDMFDRDRPCEMCCVSGNRGKWASMIKFADLLDRVVSKEPT
jgi:hypothetical protein